MDLFDVYANEQVLGQGKKSYALSFVFEKRQNTDRQRHRCLNENIISLCEQQLGGTAKELITIEAGYSWSVSYIYIFISISLIVTLL